MTGQTRAVPPAQLHRRSSRGSVAVTPADAGWRYLSFEVGQLDAPTSHLDTGDREAVLVLLVGPSLVVPSVGELPGRASPFDALPSAIYVPPGWRVDLNARAPTQVAVAWAPPGVGPSVSRRPLIVGPRDVRVETRGAGNATRQVNHIIEPSFPASRLLAVEVLTPSGNWSSWPPHKHDVDDLPREAILEEVYHYRFRRQDAWGIQRVYRRAGGAHFDRDGPLDAIFEVRDGDVVIVPDGYHPFVAAHGDDAYYLNALAGDRRTMACSFDPALAWVAESWAGLEADPRVPLATAPGATDQANAE